jgi:membrane-bound lytic murein transglycosylase B
MKPALTLALLATLALAACDNPKPRPAVAPTSTAPAAQPEPAPATVAGLAKRAEMPGFSLDAINEAQDPVNQPATIQADAPFSVSGFGLDPIAKAPGKAVQIVIDGVAYPTLYGHERKDVAAYFKAEAAGASGFRADLPAGTVKPGSHTALVRVIAADGRSYFDGPPIAFTAR